MRWLIKGAVLAIVLVAGATAPAGRADAGSATHYYLSLGDSLAAAAAPGVPIVGMTYYNVFASIWFDDPATAFFIGARVDALNGSVASTYAAAGVPVADVAGAFHNGEYPLSAQLACAWTWFCSHGDSHANTAGYGVIAQAFLEVVHPGAPKPPPTGGASGRPPPPPLHFAA